MRKIKDKKIQFIFLIKIIKIKIYKFIFKNNN